MLNVSSLVALLFYASGHNSKEIDTFINLQEKFTFHIKGLIQY